MNNRIIYFLTFKIGDISLGINVRIVINILELTNISSGLNTHDFFAGIVNLQSKPLPVFNLRKKFNINNTALQDKNCILVIEIKKNENNILVGLLVDEVKEIVEILKSEIVEDDRSNSDYEDLVEGVYNEKKGNLLIINHNQIINDQDFETINENKLSKDIQYKKVFIF